MKRIISLLLAGCMLCSGAVFAEPEEEARQVSEQVQETAELLSATGILDLSDIDYFKEMTRAEAVKKLNRLRNAEVFPNTGGQVFYDLPSSNDDYQEIMTAYSLGYVSGYSDNTFRPDQKISAKEFGVMAVRMLGYGQGAKVDSGFLSLAYDLGIFDGVETQKPAMNYEDFVKMAENIFDAPVYKVEIKDGKYTISSDKDHNALSEFHGIYKEKGVMQKNTLTSIVGTEASPGSVTVSGIEYATDSHDFDGLLGYEVEIFYYDDSTSRETVYVRAKGKTDEVTVSAYDIDGYSDNILSYSTGSRKSKNARLDPAFKVVLNGKITTDYVADYSNPKSIFREPNGTVRLVDTEGNGRYDIVFVETYLNAILLKAYTEDDNTVLKLSIQYEAVIEFNLTDDNMRVEAYAADGKKYTGKDLINLTAGSILSIYADQITEENGKRFVSDDSEYVRIYESMQTVSGKLEAISEDDGLTTYTVAGEKYLLSDNNYMHEIQTQLGDTRAFLLNVYGEVVGVTLPEEDPESFQYGYLIKAVVDDSGDSEKLVIRMLITDGTVKKFYCTEKLSVNNTRVKNFDVLIDQLEDSAKLIVAGKTDMSQLVKYKLNAEGEITKIETVIDRDHHDDRLSLDNRKKHLMARTKGGVMSSWSWESVEMDDGTMSGYVRTMYFIPDTVFLVPENMRTEDAYYGKLKLKDEQLVYAEAWDIGNDIRPKAMVVYASASNEDIGITPNVIREIREAIDDDGSIVTKLYAHNGTSDKEYVIEKRDDEEAYNRVMSLKKGDIAWLSGDDAHDIVRDANILFRIDDPPKLYERTPIIHEVSRYQFMELYYVDRERYLTTQRGAIVSGKKREEQFPWCWSGDSSMMRGAVLYDATGKKPVIRTATPADLKPAYSYGNKECSKVFTCEGFGSPTFIVVYNGLEL